jgi:hypothetical protein
MDRVPYVEINSRTCPGCEGSIETPDATIDCYIDGHERAWHWSYLNQVASGWPGRPRIVKPDPLVP